MFEKKHTNCWDGLFPRKRRRDSFCSGGRINGGERRAEHSHSVKVSDSDQSNFGVKQRGDWKFKSPKHRKAA